jgi:flagellar hook-associated protein 1 FlgK
MGSLFSALQTASTALDVFSQALGTSQSNVANASTPGYAAQQANILPIDLSGDGASVSDFISLSSNSSAFADATVQAASSQASASQTSVEQLTPVNQLFDITGTSGILAALQQFSSAFSTLSVTPSDSTAQANALAAAGNVASSFQSVAASLDTQQAQIASNIQSTLSQINDLAGDIQQINVRTIGEEGTSDPSTDASLRSDLDQLSSLVDITVTKNADGSVSVLAGGQLPVVEGSQAYTISANPAAAPGSQISSSAGGNSPPAFSGQLGALLATDNTVIGGLLGSGGNPGTLNTLAAGFATSVNSLLTSGVTSSGAAGVPIFTFDTTDPTNSARTLSLISSVTPAQLAVATTGASAESNGTANALAALPASTSSGDEIDGQSAEGFFGSIAASVGQQLSDAETASTSDQASLTAAQTNRQQQIGVSLDQEAANITTYQRGYDANAQVVQVLSQLTDDTVNMISGSDSAL